MPFHSLLLAIFLLSNFSEATEEAPPNLTIPTHFDARLAWPQCSAIINRIPDQGRCGSCWAVSSTSAMSDRLCIASKGALQVHISAGDLLQCCPDHQCADGEDTGGCNGGDPLLAWKYFATHGLTTESCKPYPVSPCPKENGTRPVCFLNKSRNFTLGKCTTSCSTGSQAHHYFGSTYYNLTSGDVRAAQLDILHHGPLVASYDVYEDFLNYTSGVYSRSSTAKNIVGHSVRVLGWGVENDGTEYWLAANSWNTDWGKLGGFFKIRRGTNECGFEEWMVGGLVRV